MKRCLAVVMSLVPAVALAQPAPEPVAPSPPPRDVEDDPVTSCKRERAAKMQAAQSSPDAGERTRLLTALPDCSSLEAAAAARQAAQQSPPPSPVPPPPPRESTVKEGPTAEIAAGLGFVTAGGDVRLIDGIGGINVGIGNFISPQVAVTFRIAGLTILEDGVFGYAGFAGPSAQLWVTSQVFVGVGLGAAFVAVCGGGFGCDGEAELGLDARIGLAFSKTGRGANVSLEMTTLENVKTVGFLVGYQSF